MMYLQLPLPQKTTREIKILVIPSDLTLKPTYYRVSVLKEGSIEDVKKAIVELSKDTQLLAEDIEICDVYNHKFFKVFKNNEPQSAIQDRDVIHAYCLTPEKQLEEKYRKEGEEEKVDFVKIVTLHKSLETSVYGKKSLDGFGSPLILKLPNKIKYSDLALDIFNRLKRIIKQKEKKEESKSNENQQPSNTEEQPSNTEEQPSNTEEQPSNTEEKTSSVTDDIPFKLVLSSEYGDEKKVFEDEEIVEFDKKRFFFFFLKAFFKPNFLIQFTSHCMARKSHRCI